MQDRPTQNQSLLFFALLVSLIYFTSLLPLIALSPIGGSSEAREVHVARIIYESGEWVLPMRNGLVPSKPPFFHWCVALVGKIVGGVDAFTARLVSLTFAAGFLFLTMLLCGSLLERVAPTLTRKSRISAALGAALILTTSYLFIQMSGDARVDMPFSFFVVLAVSCLMLPLAREREINARTLSAFSDRDFLNFYLASALAVLSKGPLGFVLTASIGFLISLSLLGTKRSVRLWIKPRLAWLIFLLIVCTWYVLAYIHGGSGFIGRQLLFENLQRFAGGEHVNSEAFWYYGPSFLRSVMPWSLLFFALIIRNLLHRPIKSIVPNAEGQSTNYLSLPLLWFFTGFLLFSAATGKRNSYLLPLLAPVAIYVSWSLHRSGFEFPYRLKQFFKNVIPLAFTLVLICLEIFLDFVSPRSEFARLAKNFLLSSRLHVECALILPIFVFIVCSLLKVGTQWKNVTLIFGAWYLVAFFTFAGLAVKNSLRQFDRDAAQINLLIPGTQPLVVIRERFEELLDPLLYYLNRPVTIQDLDELTPQCGAHYLFENHYLSKLPNQQANAWTEIAKFRQPIDAAAGKVDRTVHLYSYNCRESGL